MVRCVLDGSLVIPDVSRTTPGRGAWLHPRQTCLTAARRGGFARSFRRAVHVSDDLAAVIESCWIELAGADWLHWAVHVCRRVRQPHRTCPDHLLGL